MKKRTIERKLTFNLYKSVDEYELHYMIARGLPDDIDYKDIIWESGGTKLCILKRRNTKNEIYDIWRES